jgi:hypothetical protein
MQYHRQLLRFADLLSLILIGVGALNLVLAVVVAFRYGVTPLRYGKHSGDWLTCYLSVGVASCCLGLALNLVLARMRDQPQDGRSSRSTPPDPTARPDRDAPRRRATDAPGG